jgi:DNA-binding transcriptional ArsR family regulator
MALMRRCAYLDASGMDQITALQAEVLRVLANDRRLEILHLVAEEPRSVSMLAASLAMSQPNASQHLAVMRTAGLVEAERVGRETRYRIADPDVIVACDVMRGVLQRRLERLSRLADRARVPELLTAVN